MLATFLDTETTGLDANKHHIIDIAFKIIDLSSKKLITSYQSIIKRSFNDWEKRDPASIQINGYTWEQLQRGKEVHLVAHEIIQLFQSLDIRRGKAVFICQNPSFDRYFFAQLIDIYTQEKLNWPYHWLDLASMYWVVLHQQIEQKRIAFPNEITLSKNSVAQTYQLPPEPVPHLAINGVNHLIACYQAVLQTSFAY